MCNFLLAFLLFENLIDLTTVCYKIKQPFIVKFKAPNMVTANELKTNEGCLIIDHIVPNSIAEPDVRGSHLKLQVQLTLLHCVIENLNT